MAWKHHQGAKYCEVLGKLASQTEKQKTLWEKCCRKFVGKRAQHERLCSFVYHIPTSIWCSITLLLFGTHIASGIWHYHFFSFMCSFCSWILFFLLNFCEKHKITQFGEEKTSEIRKMPSWCVFRGKTNNARVKKKIETRLSSDCGLKRVFVLMIKLQMFYGIWCRFFIAITFYVNWP